MRRIVGVVAAGVLLALIPALAGAAGPKVCRGTTKKPGVLKGGRYPNGVVVRGVCAVNSGPARVMGRVEVEPGGALVAGFGRNHSRLTVIGSVVVERGAALLLGCNTTSFPCVDDPANSNHNVKPTLHSYGRVTGSVIESGALGVIIHSTTIGGNVTQSGGGGGRSCKPPKTGVFSLFKSPIFSDYEDNTISGNLSITGLTSCYLGVLRNTVHTLTLKRDQLGDPDAIEVGRNQVLGNLVCKGNSRVWDSSETGNALFPRKTKRNRVAGKRVGQCRKASPVKKGGGSAGGPF
jgi:hypothetical protein